jgi:hypothetical protein
MTQPCHNSAAPLSVEPDPRTAGREIAQAWLSLLAELEASLQASQRALLDRDVACLEQSSGEQIRLLHALEIFWPSPRNDPAQDDSALAAELRAAQMRVLHLGRVQAALLARAQRWLRTIENLLAGPATNYTPYTATRVPLSAALPLRSGTLQTVVEEEGRAPCRD